MASTRRIALMGVLTGMVYVGRITFSFLPNVQPMTTILILITLTLGFKEGLTVAVLSIMISNLSLGMGVWTLAQIASFTIIVLLTALQRRTYSKTPMMVMALFSGACGLIYGLVISLVQAPFFGWMSFIPYYLSGIPYDISHAVGNFGFYIILAPLLLPMLIKQDKKLMKIKQPIGGKQK